MGTLFSTFDIARSGLVAAQVQLDTAAHNIANVNTEGYSRQRVELMTRRPIIREFGQIGRGVSVTNIHQIRDGFVDAAYRRQVPGLGSAEIQSNYYRLLDGIFLEPAENGFGARLSAFFDALSDFSNNVESFPTREALVSEAADIAVSLNQVADRFYTLRTNANEEVRNMVPEINSLGRRIAELNVLIRDTEVNETSANDLRDERGRLLDELARLVEINTVETDNGQIHVFIRSDAFIEGHLVSELEAVRNPLLDPSRPDLLEVRFAGSGRLVDIRGGELHGALQVRDTIVPLYEQRMNELAAALIENVNRIHSQGRGLSNWSGTVTSANPVSAAGDPLTAAGLPFAVTPGTFDVVVYDAAGTPTATTITITAATTLNDLATALNAVPNFSATVVGERLELGAAAGFTFSFANDSTNALVALGINGMFTGHNAATIGVNQALVADANLVTSSFGFDVLNTGDNTAALAMAALRTLRLLDGESSTISEHYESTIGRLGVDSRANAGQMRVQQAFVDDFNRRRQEVSGVSLDEEVANLIQFQRAFEASARVFTVTDRMLEALLTMAL